MVLLSVLSIRSVASENVLLYRLKKLRNNFLVQVAEQVSANDNAVHDQILLTTKQVLAKFDEAKNEADNLQKNLCGMSEACEDQLQPKSFAYATDDYLSACIAKATAEVDSLTTVLAKAEAYQTEAMDFSIWFLEDYLADASEIFTEKHYNDVYAKLSEKILLWDNVTSVNLYRFRQEVMNLLNQLLTTTDDCLAQSRAYVAADFGALYIKTLKCN